MTVSLNFLQGKKTVYSEGSFVYLCFYIPILTCLSKPAAKEKRSIVRENLCKLVFHHSQEKALLTSVWLFSDALIT